MASALMPEAGAALQTGQTALYLAVSNSNHWKMAECMLRHGADVNFQCTVRLATRCPVALAS
jgi:hypothetical protein